MIGTRCAALALIVLLILNQNTRAIEFSDRSEFAGVADSGRNGGAAFGDYDGDGWPDLLVAAEAGAEALLYRNTGDGRFEHQPGALAESSRALGALFVDLESDGDLDVYLVQNRKQNQSFLQVDGGFELQLLAQELSDAPLATSALFNDFDGDGRLDLFATHQFPIGNQYFTGFLTDAFADGTKLASTLRSGPDSYGAASLDYDSDGDRDIYVCNFDWPNLLHRNDGNGLFTQVASELGADHDGATLSATPGDYDNDGDMDLILLNRSAQNVLYENRDGGHFDDITGAMGLDAGESSAGAEWADFDNDGDLDLLISGFSAPELWRNDGSEFVVLGDSSFANATAARSGLGLAVADYDGDGDVDAFISSYGSEDMLLRNDTTTQGHWLAIDLEWREGSSSAVGTRITAETEASTQLREFSATSNLGTLSGDLLHIGLGDAETVRQLVVEWPGGGREVRGPIDADQTVSVQQPLLRSDLAISRIVEPTGRTGWSPLFAEAEISNEGSEPIEGAVLRVSISHAESGELYSTSITVPPLNPSETVRVRAEDAWQPLLSGFHQVLFELPEDDVAANNEWLRELSLHQFDEVGSELGVNDASSGFAGAMADYDNDGDIDLYLSNGGWVENAANVLYRNDGARFSDVTELAGAQDEGNGTGVAFADVDRDGFQDLMVGKGGFDVRGQQNRLLHNNGDGTFEDISVESGLDFVSSTYTTAVGDYDRDGNIDFMFSQLRGQPHLLYRNTGDGRFVDVTETKQILYSNQFDGSAAIFTDYDNDGDLDLLQTVFGGNAVLYTDAGASAYEAAAFGIAGDAVGLTIGDYDEDGDLDIYVANLDGQGGPVSVETNHRLG